MPKKDKKEEGGCGCMGGHRHHGVHGGCTYGMAVIGAAVYFIKGAATFGAGAWGLAKAIAWPAVLMFELLKHLKI